MKEWQTNLIGSVVVIIFGAGLLGGAMSINIPSQYKTFLGIPYQVNPEYVVRMSQMIGLLIMGLFLEGVGIGILANTYTIFRLEKKLEPNAIVHPPPPPSFMEKRYCRFCGTENKKDSIYCEKCGRQIS